MDEISGVRMKLFFDRYVRGVKDVPLDKLLAPFGVSYADQRQEGRASLGVALTRDGNDCKLANVYEGGAAHLAGLSAGDILIAVDGLRVTMQQPKGNLDTLLAGYPVGSKVALHAFRRDELLTLTATLKGDATPAVSLTLSAADSAQKSTKAKTKATALNQPTLKRPSQR